VSGDGRSLPPADREAHVEARLAGLLQAHFAASDVRVSEAVRQEHLVRLKECAAERRAEADGAQASPPAVTRLRAGTSAPAVGREGPAAGPRFLRLLAGPALATALLAAAFVIAWRQQSGEPEPPELRIRTIQAATASLAPEGVLGPRGRLHLVYGRDDNAYYLRTDDAGRALAEPVRLNDRPGTVSLGGEHGPKIAYGRDGTVHVVWLSGDSASSGVWYARSTDGGRTFERERNIADTRAACDSATVAADREGRVWVFWLDRRLGAGAGVKMAAPILMARSVDDGRTFTPNERVRHDHPGLACSCCRLEARLSRDGALYLSFRSAYRNIRDAYLLKGLKTENDFRAVRISEDNWLLADCPGSGVRLNLDDEGRVLASWMSRGRVYWAMSDTGGQRFGPRIPAPTPGGDENYPQVLTNHRGEVLLLWTEGSRVHWAAYDRSGAFRGREGVAGDVGGREKPLGFVGPDGEFRLLL
jgi:hypothetical protein